MREEPLQWTSRPGGRSETTVLEFTGPFTLGNIFEVQKMLAETDGPVTVLDLSNVPFMDSAGLGVLMNFYVRAEKNGRRMAIAGANERVGALLDMTRVRDLLRVSPDVVTAETAAAL